MQTISRTGILLFSVLSTSTFAEELQIPAAPNGITMPKGFAKWNIIAPSLRSDRNFIRIILGNDIAMAAIKSGQTTTWPDGAILAKLSWTPKQSETFAEATVPDKFAQVEFMIKDSSKYQTTANWGFARWVGEELKPYGNDANFAQECVVCHTPVKAQDYVYTRMIQLPEAIRE